MAQVPPEMSDAAKLIGVGLGGRTELVDASLQVFLFGDDGVGKSSLLYRFTAGTYKAGFNPPKDSVRSQIVVVEGKRIELQVRWGSIA